MAALQRVCVFCGSKHGRQTGYTMAARKTGRVLAERGIGVVYGGGDVGLMGEVADAALEAGGEVTGVIPSFMVGQEVAHAGLTRLDVVDSMHERKARMAELADAFVALPGGWGTLEELFEVVTWAQLGLHAKPVGLLDVGGFFDDLLQFLDRAVAEGFVTEAHRGLLVADDDIERLLDTMARSSTARSPTARSSTAGTTTTDEFSADMT
jgi:uncharacterized protein (TIGR00730 family)